tara:strand:- start:31 stop:192 length:162 start_codon:yes stop_codon:yes gene_type:complete
MINKGDLLGSNLLFLLNRKLVAFTPKYINEKSFNLFVFYQSHFYQCAGDISKF